jgi:hypothetical protein
MWTAASTFDLETIETTLGFSTSPDQRSTRPTLEWTRTVRCEKSPLDTTKSTHLRKKSWTCALWEYENGSQELRASGLRVGKESGRLGHPMNYIEYPDIRVKLTGTDRNSYAIIGRLRRALRDARVSCRGVLRQGDFGRLRQRRRSTRQTCARCGAYRDFEPRAGSSTARLFCWFSSSRYP